MQLSDRKGWITFLCIAGFWLYYPIVFILMLLEVHCGIVIKGNQILALLLLFSGVPLGTYGIYRAEWDILSKILAWIVCVLAVIGCLLPFGFLVIYLFGFQAT
jgi:hypothetical protein